MSDSVKSKRKGRVSRSGNSKILALTKELDEIAADFKSEVIITLTDDNKIIIEVKK